MCMSHTYIQIYRIFYCITDAGQLSGFPQHRNISTNVMDTVDSLNPQHKIACIFVIITNRNKNNFHS
jgi:hypothetical protein